MLKALNYIASFKKIDKNPKKPNKEKLLQPLAPTSTSIL